MKITAAVLDRPAAVSPYSASRPLRLAELELAEPQAGELLVRIDAAGVCHSDLSVVNGDRPRPTPMALGHEACATVLRAGSAQSAFAPGDRVVLAFLPACGACADCGSGRGYLCEPATAANGAGQLLRGGRRLSDDGRAVFHHLGVSAFATHAVVDERSAVKVDGDIPATIAALFGCAVLTGVGSVLNTAAARAGESIVIFGLGGVGLAAVMGAAVAGCHPIIVVDPIQAKRELALTVGATLALSPAEVAGRIPELASGGTDIAVETVGRASVLKQAYDITRRGGRTVTVGLPPPDDLISIAAVSLVGGARTLMGSYMGSAIPRRDVPRYIALWRAGRLPVERLLTSVSPLADINLLLDALAAGTAIRQIIVPNQGNLHEGRD